MDSEEYSRRDSMLSFFAYFTAICISVTFLIQKSESTDCNLTCPAILSVLTFIWIISTFNFFLIRGFNILLGCVVVTYTFIMTDHYDDLFIINTITGFMLIIIPMVYTLIYGQEPYFDDESDTESVHSIDTTSTAFNSIL
jgi:hypothetical protein